MLKAYNNKLNSSGFVQVFCCAFIAIVVLMLIFAASAFGGLRNGNGTQIPGEGLSDIVPPNFASLFTEASQASGVPAALIAAIYLTEHHTDTFGEDLSSINDTFQDYYGSACTENGSGAAGPMQFIPSSWPASKLTDYGISSPDRCKFRDSIIGAGFLLAGKVQYDSVADVCKKNSDGSWNMTEECISLWGQAYCGVGGCNNANCGAPNYLYCEEVVRKYNLVVGT